jgi:hypothetical protein
MSNLKLLNREDVSLAGMYDWSGTKQLFDPNIILKKTISEIWS